MKNELIECIERKHMDDLLKHFASLDRLSGSSDAGKAADYILGKLKSWDIQCEMLEFESYVSNPVGSSLMITDHYENYEISCRPRSFAADVPEGVEGVLWYDEDGTVKELRNKNKDAVRGKVVLSFNYDEDYARVLSDLGAVGLIQIWHSDEEIIHEDTVGCVWGTPTLLTEPMLPRIPVVGVTLQSGKSLIDKLKLSELKVKITTDIHYEIQRLQLPVALIPGRTKDFILLSGHYDSWYYGATDNGTGNALCLEIARIFHENRAMLEKSLVVAWWPGHSNGRYSGSTWFCDQYWSELNEHCYGHINMDSPGCCGAEQVVLGTTRFEGTEFLKGKTEVWLGREPKGYSQLFKGADQSFFGCRIPIHIYPMFKQAEGNKIYASPGSGGGWWWHTPADTSDKVDMQLLLRDTKYITSLLEPMLCEPVVPSDGEKYFEYVNEILTSYDRQSDEEFDFTQIIEVLQQVTESFEQACRSLRGNADALNRLYKTVGGEMNRLMNSYSDRYDFDLAMPASLFPGLGIVNGVYRNTCNPKDYLFIKTQFVRQKNRFINEVKHLVTEINCLLQFFQEGEK